MRALDNMNYKRVKKIFMNDSAVEEQSSFEIDDDSSSQVFVLAHIYNGKFLLSFIKTIGGPEICLSFLSIYVKK